ncbi:ead/Ea22-like family protein, partial [Pseudomonas agarici]
MIDNTELKKLAEKASPGPWWVDSHGMTMMSMPDLQVVFNHPQQSVAVRNEETGNLSHWRNDWDASYIAAANPAAVLALIAESERLERLALDSVNAEYAGSMDLESICAERDQLRAENAGLKTGYEAYERVNAGLRAEVEGLRKDAERYRWLRERAQQDVDGWRNDVPVLVHALSHAPEWKERIDESIDAAMGKGEQ